MGNYCNNSNSKINKKEREIVLKPYDIRAIYNIKTLTIKLVFFLLKNILFINTTHFLINESNSPNRVKFI